MIRFIKALFCRHKNIVTLLHKPWNVCADCGTLLRGKQPLKKVVVSTVRQKNGKIKKLYSPKRYTKKQVDHELEAQKIYKHWLKSYL